MNTIGLFRSNYYKVKDAEAFVKWCDRRGLEAVESEEHPGLVGFVNDTNESGIPRFDWETGEECDFFRELETHLVDGHVAIVIEISYEGESSLRGSAHAINARGDSVGFSLSDILSLASQLGEHVTEL